MFPVASETEKLFCIIVDKLEKIGLEKVLAALQQAGFGEQTMALLVSLAKFRGDNGQLLAQLHATIGHTAQGIKGLGGGIDPNYRASLIIWVFQMMYIA